MRKPTTQQTFGPLEVKRVNHEPLTTVDELDLDRKWLGLVPRALGKIGTAAGTAAGTLGISPQLFSAQCSAVEDKQLSYRRMRKLGPDFWRELILLILDFHDIAIGATPQDQTDAQIGRLVREAVTRCR